MTLLENAVYLKGLAEGLNLDETKAEGKLIAKLLELPPYRDEKPITDAFVNAFYDSEKKLFKDSDKSSHISILILYSFYPILYRDFSCDSPFYLLTFYFHGNIRR